jgi:hypothetical protein
MPFIEFSKAKEYVRKLEIKNFDEWYAFCKSGKKPTYIPARPESVYRKKGWVGYGDWLGNGRKPRQKDFFTYDEAKKFVSKLGIKSHKEWRAYCKSGKKPKKIPANPEYYYRYSGWTWWGDWLGAEDMVSHWMKHWKFDDARKFVQSLNLLNYDEWREYCKSGKKPKFIPSNPNEKYKKSGWSGYRDWFGVRIKQREPVLVTF